MAGAEVEYRYRHAASLRGSRGLDLTLEACNPTLPESTRFFTGFAERAEVVAAGLLAVARVARTRFYTPFNVTAAKIRAADPVVTCDGERLRFESLSMCCGVYARLDLLPEGIEGETLQTGTTNIDVNAPLRDALGRVGTMDPLHLEVGPDHVRVRTIDDDQIERKVDLPARWLKSFAEVSLLSSIMEPRFELDAAGARRVLLGLPGSRTRGRLWVSPSGRAARLASRPGAGSVHLSGPERLGPFQDVLRFVTSLGLSGPRLDGDEPAASAWTAALPGARLSLVLSPEASRAFSGEGGVLAGLGDDQALSDAQTVADTLAARQHASLETLTAACGVESDRCRGALSVLGAGGQVGYDVTDGEFFVRTLPFEPSLLESMHPRSVAAKELIAAGGVVLDGKAARVTSGDAHYTLDWSGGRWRCNCPWDVAHGGRRGMCKHVLAVSTVESAG